jgi:hypothetical protein
MNEGIAIAASVATTTVTIINSINVKPRAVEEGLGNVCMSANLETLADGRAYLFTRRRPPATSG